MRPRIKRPAVRPDVGGGRGDAHDVLHAGVETGDVEGGFYSELVGEGLRGDEGAGYVVGAEPVRSDFGPGFFEDGDAGEGGELLGGGRV